MAILSRSGGGYTAMLPLVSLCVALRSHVRPLTHKNITHCTLHTIHHTPHRYYGSSIRYSNRSGTSSSAASDGGGGVGGGAGTYIRGQGGARIDYELKLSHCWARDSSTKLVVVSCVFQRSIIDSITSVCCTNPY